MQKKWLIKAKQNPAEVERLRSELKVDRVVAELLLQRGISTYEEAERFFRPRWEELHDPFLMKDLREAVLRINQAMGDGEHILLFGDYDVDGTTAVAMMYTFLAEIYPNVDYYIPDRYAEGYGVSYLGIDRAEASGVSLIISLDCGIRSVNHVQYAREKGIDFIVCDHHEPGDEIPDCLVLDPKRSDCSYPYKELSGCGVGFKLLQGMCHENNWGEAKLHELVDFTAVSIGADIVPVTGENRILSFYGMQKLNAKPRKAFEELLRIAKREFPVTLTDVVFTIAPRINAAGRLRSGRFAVELMISGDSDEIRTIAAEIDEDNSNRRLLDKEMTEEALELIEADAHYNDKKSTVVFKKDWHKGVVGIVASRLIEKHFRPTIVLTESNGKITGSARSVSQFDIHQALISCSDLLEQFGGHTHAAGLTMLPENLDLFQRRFDEVVQQGLRLEDTVPEQEVDLELHFDEVFGANEDRTKVPRLKRILKQFEPHGPGNMKPVFLAENCFSRSLSVLKNEHLKLTVTQPDSDVIVDAIGFFMADKQDLVASGLPFDMVFTLETNRWKNKESLQLTIKDIRPVL